MLTINAFVDTISKDYNSVLKEPFNQGNNNVKFKFTLTENGVPIRYDSVSAIPNNFVINAFITTFNRLDFKTTIVQCYNNPIISFELIPNTDNYNMIITCDTSIMTELFSTPFKNNIAFKINRLVNGQETFYTFTSPYEYNVLKNESYILSNLSTNNN